MLRSLLLSLLFLSGGAFGADDLAQADRLLAAKDYGKAMPMFTRLANAGNPEAQLRLGEMYWFGEGTAQDLDAARRWFEKAAATGNAGARESLAALDRRKTRGAEIVHWTQGYDGADLRAGKFACPVPAIPASSKTNEEIKATRAAIEAWRLCHAGFVANMNATAKGGAHIPAEVLDMMTPDEASRAQAHVADVYGKLVAQANADVETVGARQAAWQLATEDFIKSENLRIAVLNEERRRALDQERRMRTEAREGAVRPAPLPSAPAGR